MTRLILHSGAVNKLVSLPRSFMMLVTSTSHVALGLKLSFLAGAIISTAYWYQRSSMFLFTDPNFFFGYGLVMARYWGEFALTGGLSTLAISAILYRLIRRKGILSDSFIGIISLVLATSLTIFVWMSSGGALERFLSCHSLLSTDSINLFMHSITFYGLPGFAGGASSLALSALIRTMKPSKSFLLLGRKS